MRTIYNTIFVLFFSFQAIARQSQTSVSGLVRNLQNDAMPAATVRLLRITDSITIKSQVTSETGKFRFTGLLTGDYMLSVSAVGKKDFTGLPFRIDEMHQTMLLPVIIMSDSKTQTLAEVKVIAKRPLIEQEIDKTIVNVASMISSASSNTMEVLEKTPGIVVNANGDISLNGRSGVLVLIDGRSTYMSGQDLAAYLKSLPGSMLDKIELINNPSARYDAAGNAIINIRLKKNRAAGYTGNISFGYSQGRYGRNNVALSLNYNRKKVNLFGTLGYNKEKSYTTDASDRRFYNSNFIPVSSILLDNRQQLTGKSINVAAGLDYQASAYTNVGIQVNLNDNDRNARLDFNSSHFTNVNHPDTLGAGLTDGKDSRINLATNLNFLHRFGKTGRELSADLNYLHYGNEGLQQSENNILLPDGTLQSRSDFLYRLPSDISIYTFKADYVHPMKSNAKIEAGIKSGIVGNDYVADFYNIFGEQHAIDNSKSNHFRYQEMISAAYFNGQKSWARFGTQIGLRVENTRATGNQLGNQIVPASRFSKNYTQLFPAIYFNYKLDSAGKNTLTLSLTRRINRPNYQQLNPFVFFRDKYSYTAGNPLLSPQYQYRYELRFTYRQFFRSALSYNRFTNVIFQTTQAVGDIFITAPQNVARGYMLLLNNGISLKPFTWWNLNSDVQLSFIGLNGQAYTEQLAPKTFVARFNLINQLQLSKNWSAEWGGYYASQDLNGQAFTGSMIRANAGIQKKIWKEKGSIRISADDIFHSWIYHNRSVSLKQSRYFQTSWSDTQRIAIAFTYRFGKEDLTRKRRHNNNAADDEKGRVE